MMISKHTLLPDRQAIRNSGLLLTPVIIKLEIKKKDELPIIAPSFQARVQRPYV